MSATVFFESASELATIRNVFKVGGTATDPTTVSLIITDPTGTATTYTYAAGQITKNATGDYQKDIACSIDSTWTYEWTGTGAASDVVAGTWEVHPTDVGKLYPTVEALKSRLNITTTAHDLEVHSACFAASRWVEQFCQRTFYRTASASRTFVPDDLYCLNLPEFNDLVSISTLKTDTGGDGTFETTWASSDYQLWPVNPSAAPEQRPYMKIRAIGTNIFPRPYGTLARDDRVEITGIWGWPVVPLAVKQAALMAAAETFKLKDAPFGFADFGESGIARIGAGNTRVMAMLNPYRRVAVLVA